MGMLAAFAVYVSVPLIEQRLPDELGLAHLARELAAGIAVGAALLSAMMGVPLVTGVYAMSGPTAAAPWQALTGSLEGTGEELIFRGAIFRLLCALGVWWARGLSSRYSGRWTSSNPGSDSKPPVRTSPPQPFGGRTFRDESDGRARSTTSESPYHAAAFGSITAVSNASWLKYRMLVPLGWQP
jgi:hypothetical protein